MSKVNKSTIDPRIHEFTMRKPTPDNWHPTHEDGTVEVRGFVQKTLPFHKTSHPCWARVCVWGEDDFGLELDFEGTRLECIEWYQKWHKYFENCALITQKNLIDLGFKPA